MAKIIIYRYTICYIDICSIFLLLNTIIFTALCYGGWTSLFSSSYILVFIFVFSCVLAFFKVL